MVVSTSTVTGSVSSGGAAEVEAVAGRKDCGVTVADGSDVRGHLGSKNICEFYSGMIASGSYLTLN